MPSYLSPIALLAREQKSKISKRARASFDSGSEGSGEAETTSKLSLTDDGVTSSKEKGVESYGIGE